MDIPVFNINDSVNDSFQNIFYNLSLDKCPKNKMMYIMLT